MQTKILSAAIGALMQEAGAAGSTGGTTPAKPKTEVTLVKMSDGREVGFAGKRKMVKSTIIDDSKIVSDNNTITLEKGAVSVRLDFRNGETRVFTPPVSLVAKSVGHGLEQKLGDETAGEAKVEDMVLAVDDLMEQLSKGEWGVVREAGGFSGASIVIRAIMEASGKTQDAVKEFLQKKLDDAKTRNEKLSRKDLYDSFRNPNSKTGKIIARMEEEERAKNAKVDADAALAELG